MPILSDIIHSESIPVTLHRGLDLKPLWQAKDSTLDLRDYCYVVADSAIAKHTGVDEKDVVIGYSERYGGSGIGPNGGGARAANFNNMQVKGLGAHPDLCTADDVTHSYGGCDAICAIKETIMSHVCNLVLPYGAVNIQGLIWVSETAGIFDDKPTWGVLMVRDPADRPAHLIRSAGFHPKKGSGVRKDPTRIRLQMQRIHRELGPQAFMEQMLEAIQRDAEQNAAARMSRMVHYTMTHSNLTLDGRWIDLSLASFVNSGVNSAQNTDFRMEHRRFLRAVRESVYNYCKYNRVVLDTQQLDEHHNTHRQIYKRLYAGWCLGITPQESVGVVKQATWRVLSKYIENTIVGTDKQRILDHPRLAPTDPLILFVSDMINIVANNGVTKTYKPEHADMFDLLGHCAVTMYGKTTSNPIAELQLRLVQGLKQTYLSAFFMLFYQDGRARDVCYNGKPSDIPILIDSCNAVADWVFQRESDRVVLYKTHKLAIAWNPTQGFMLNRLAINPKALLEYIQDNPDEFFIHNWDFSDWLVTAIKAITGVLHEA